MMQILYLTYLFLVASPLAIRKKSVTTKLATEKSLVATSHAI
jgi:hypothetical protein